MKNWLFFGLLFVIFSQVCFGQRPSGKAADPDLALEHFSHNNYVAAMRIYKELLNAEPDDIEYNYKLAQCYLRTNIDKKQAIIYLEKLSRNDKIDAFVWFDLGRAYQYANRFDDAIKAYTKYKVKSNKKSTPQADRAIETCYNGIELVKHPLNVTFENLGKNINSEFADYYPLATTNESFMVFTSRRKGGKSTAIEMDGLYGSDIYMTTVKEGNWTKAVNLGTPINTPLDEQAVGLSSDGTNMIVYIDHIDSLGNIYSTKNVKGKFQGLVKLPEEVNAGIETSGCMTDDGQTIYYASNRNGGFGGTDLYRSKKLPNGNWGIPQNLGKDINTPYNEDFPTISQDGNTLYFASEGHSSMGGYDIFKSVYNEETNVWSAPQNIGYPLNTSDDNMTISFTTNNRVAYLSAKREGGLGDLDIWRVSFPEEEARISIVYGMVTGNDSLHLPADMNITVSDPKMPDALPQTYRPIPSSGKYVMGLTPGKYNVSVEADGYNTINETLIILDKGSFLPEINKNFKLTKQLKK